MWDFLILLRKLRKLWKIWHFYNLWVCLDKGGKKRHDAIVLLHSEKENLVKLLCESYLNAYECL